MLAQDVVQDGLAPPGDLRVGVLDRGADGGLGPRPECLELPLGSVPVGERRAAELLDQRGMPALPALPSRSVMPRSKKFLIRGQPNLITKIKIGKAIAARIRMIATTIRSSMSEKPRRSRARLISLIYPS